jgi:hypothetical protein
MSYTQEELDSIWQKLVDGPEPGEFEKLDVSAMVRSFGLSDLTAGVVTYTDTEQAMAFLGSVDKVGAYTDFDSQRDDTAGTYARLRDNKEGPWGEWKKR